MPTVLNESGFHERRSLLGMPLPPWPTSSAAWPSIAENFFVDPFFFIDVAILSFPGLDLPSYAVRRALRRTSRHGGMLIKRGRGL